MPYIKRIDRMEQYRITDSCGNNCFLSKEDIAEEIGRLANNAGEFNFMFSAAMDAYLKKKGKNYANINELIGMLECCKMELYRVIAAPYEDEKIAENGHAYTVQNMEGTKKYA